MNSENKSNESSSATTSPSEPQKNDSQAGAPADYLEQQQAHATAAISNVFSDMGRALKDGADVTEWTRQYPWIMAGSAIAAGFLAGWAVTPHKDETYREKFERMRDKLAALQAKKDADDAPAAVAATAAAKPSFFATVLHEVVRAAGPAITGLITGSMAQSDEHDGHNGHGQFENPATSASPQPGASEP